MENAASHESLLHESALASDVVLRVLGDDGALDPAWDPSLPDDLVVALHREMNLVRALDEALTSLKRQGRIAVHEGWAGEEAAILGSAAAMRDRDRLFPGHLELGAALWRGMPLASYVGHVFGNERDPMKGRQLADYRSRSGAHITQAVGFAWAAKIKRDDVVTLVHFAHSALASGEFHNGVNFAGVFKVPLVLFCRRGLARGERMNDADHADRDRALAYGITSSRCDGGDLFAVLKATRDAVTRAAGGGGTTLIEALTPHPSDVTDRDAARREGASLDPLARVRRHLEARGLWGDDRQRDLDATLDAEITAAIASADALGAPSRETMFDDVYAAPIRSLDEQRAELLAIPARP